MRVFFSSDLHVDVQRGMPSAVQLAAWVCQRSAPDDVLILGGDYGNDDDAVARCLRLFRRFRGAKLAIAGNHDVWSKHDAGAGSRARYEGLAGVFANVGFHALEHSPFRLGRVGFAGAMGWYDFSLREESLEVPLEVYHAKGMPGVPGVVWADGDYVDWGITDPQFTTTQLDNLARQLDALTELDLVIVATHHVPVVELLRPRDLDPALHRRDVVPRRWLILNTYLGSDRLGRLRYRGPSVAANRRNGS
ncbi:MAG: metallophosphoesterase [Myxococcota bacterium]